MKNSSDTDPKLRALHEALEKIRVAPAYQPDKWFMGPLNFAPEIRRTMNLPERVDICDVTLREASQAYFTEKEYVDFANALDEAGVAVIQFLSPKGEPEKAEHIRALKHLGRMGLNAKLQLYGVSAEKEMDLAAEYGIDSVSFTIFPFPEWQPIYAASRKINERSEAVERSLSAGSEEALLEHVERTAQAVQSRGMKARPIANFFSMASMEFLRKLAKCCERAGVYALNFVDAAGNMGPAGYRYVISEVKKAAPTLTVGVHTHNDLGLATANALAGVEAGASQVDVTVNGVGARAGNATMVEVVVALEALYGVKTGIKLERLTVLSKIFEDLSHWPTPKDKPLVGEYAFTDASETHSFLLQADPLLFAPVRPELVGNKRRSHLTQSSGINTLRMRLNELAINFQEEKLPRLLARIKSELRTKRRVLTEEEIRDCISAVDNGGAT